MGVCLQGLFRFLPIIHLPCSFYQETQLLQAAEARFSADIKQHPPAQPPELHCFTPAHHMAPRRVFVTGRRTLHHSSAASKYLRDFFSAGKERADGWESAQQAPGEGHKRRRIVLHERRRVPMRESSWPWDERSERWVGSWRMLGCASGLRPTKLQSVRV